MGGKDSILVCADADLDAAVEGVVASAFGFSGQKCSACSRAIVEAPLYDVFVERVRERVANSPWATRPPIPTSARSSTRPRSNPCWLHRDRQEGRPLIAGGQRAADPDGGYFLEPTVFADIAPDAVLAQEEIFGPVLAIIKVASFEEGLRVANNTEYGLTGSSTPTDREKLTAPAASSTWAISTSIASAPGPWWARIPSAAST
jgi:1-pyrroline-5-carboxylate dehydrogenase